MEFTERELFTDTIQQAFLDTVPETSQLSHNDDVLLLTLEGVFSYQQSCLEHLRATTDWEKLEDSVDLSQPEDPDEAETSVQEHTERLTYAAFNDAQQLLSMAIMTLPPDVRQDHARVKDILLNSKQPLLQVARLSDKVRGDLLSYHTYDNSIREYVNQELWDQVGAGSVVEFTGSHVDWAEPIKSWLRNNIKTQDPRHGCPAHNRIIELDGQKTTLTNAFWDAIIDHGFKHLSEQP